jgi:glycine cleavage system aminomethyltransferase T
MKTLHELHLKNNATMALYNNVSMPAAYHTPDIEYKAVRENALLVDYSHMAIVSVMGEDAWALVNEMASADVSTIRDEQGIYSLILDDEGSIRGDAYFLCTDEGYYILSEDLTADNIINCLHEILENSEELDIQERPEISSLNEAGWGAVLLEGPYSWEVLAEIYGFDIIGLPYHEFMPTDDGLNVFRCGKHGEFAYLMLGEQAALFELWTRLLEVGEKYLLKTGGLDYQKTVRIENPAWDASIYAPWSRNPVELQLQWAIQYDKESFTGKTAVETFSCNGAESKLIGITPVTTCETIQAGDKVLVGEEVVGTVIKSVFSPARNSFIALAMVNKDYAYSDITGFTLHTIKGNVDAMTQNLPFLYNYSMLVNPAEHSFIDPAKLRSVL